MRAVRVLNCLGLLLIAGAATLRAQDIKDFSDRCSPGPIRSCVSIQVLTLWVDPTSTSPGYTQVVMLARNLQGSGWGIDNTGGSLLTRIGLTAPVNMGTASNFFAGSAGADVVESTAGAAAAAWGMRSGIGGAIEFTAAIIPGTTTGGIVGCNAPSSGYPSAYFSTCNGGWVAFAFTTTNRWSANDAEVAFITSRYAVNNGSTECGTDPNTDPSLREICSVVTPEPVTMLLLGSGLAGVGGVGVIRRRRGRDVESA